MLDLHVDPELKNLLPPMNLEARDQLEANCISEGRIRDPVIWWDDGEGKKVIVDGHHRYDIADRHDLPFPDEEMTFESRNAVKAWMYANAYSRRNLDERDQKLVRGRYLTLLEEMKSNGDLDDNPIAIVAAAHKVTPRTVYRDRIWIKVWDTIDAIAQKTITDASLDAPLEAIRELAALDEKEQRRVTRKAAKNPGGESLQIALGILDGQGRSREEQSTERAQTEGGRVEETDGSMDASAASPPPILEPTTKPRSSEARWDHADPCSACGCEWWVPKGEGVFACDQCGRIHGEPVGDEDEDSDEPVALGDLEMKEASEDAIKAVKKARSALAVLRRYFAARNDRRWDGAMNEIGRVLGARNGR